MNVQEKAGDLLIDIAKLIIGGVILASIISENINTLVLYISGSVCAAMLIFLGFYLYKLKPKRKEK
ncbi:MAG: hypothetical protein FWG84_00765 [Bacteroidales bacterium]|nr:hypothetical protein [Bacteroidales bacterium]